jgi:FlaA1/EpsC-like NDP-sugar epimerase
VGIRPGEKFHEELMTEEESVWARETKEMFIVQSPIELPGFTLKRPGDLLNVPLTEAYVSKQKRKVTSKNVPMLAKNEIRKLVKEKDTHHAHHG